MSDGKHIKNTRLNNVKCGVLCHTNTVVISTGVLLGYNTEFDLSRGKEKIWQNIKDAANAEK